MKRPAVSGGGFGIQSGTGQAYAIGIDDALAIANQIRAGQTSATVQIGPRALLGVEVSDGAAPSGAYAGGGVLQPGRIRRHQRR